LFKGGKGVMLVADYIQWNLENKEMNEVISPFIEYAKVKKDIVN
jgi:hypothetical protein